MLREAVESINTAGTIRCVDHENANLRRRGENLQLHRSCFRVRGPYRSIGWTFKNFDGFWYRFGDPRAASVDNIYPGSVPARYYEAERPSADIFVPRITTPNTASYYP